MITTKYTFYILDSIEDISHFPFKTKIIVVAFYLNLVNNYMHWQLVRYTNLVIMCVYVWGLINRKRCLQFIYSRWEVYRLNIKFNDH